jgi:hypothetical protein
VISQRIQTPEACAQLESSMFDGWYVRGKLLVKGIGRERLGNIPGYFTLCPSPQTSPICSGFSKCFKAKSKHA